jgi:hypothetical protein
MTAGHRVHAELTLAPTEEGGLKAPMPSGTRSLLLQFPAPGREPVTLGAEVTADDQAELAPGSSGVRGVAHFWADEAHGVAVPGAAFVLWYGGREVGQGNVLEVAE